MVIAEMVGWIWVEKILKETYIQKKIKTKEIVIIISMRKISVRDQMINKTTLKTPAVVATT